MIIHDLIGKIHNKKHKHSQTNVKYAILITLNHIFVLIKTKHVTIFPINLKGFNEVTLFVCLFIYFCLKMMPKHEHWLLDKLEK